MSERVREKQRGYVGKRGGEGLGSKGVSVSGFGVSPDRCSRSYQIGINRISLDSSDGRFGSICRLEALKGSVSHFVFLDRESVLWLEDVLLVASLIGWKFPSSCFLNSSRRTVAVSSFVMEGEQLLKIVESCSNGSFFFVLVPAASSFEGWKKFLSLCQGWIASALAPPPPPPSRSSRPVVSYANLVKGPSLSSDGRCLGSEVQGCSGVRVEKDGIQEWLDYLDRCVVFRFCSQDSIDWAQFRRWANINWGSALNAPLQKLDDDLWLLFCDSKAKVDRITSLNRNSFGDVPILLDKWIPDAGRSKVLAGDNILWLTIRGIPVHLRSSDLFRQIGSECGVFLGFETCNSLSSVRIKIRRVGDIPDSLPIFFENSVFRVEVSSDLETFIPKQDSQAFCPKGKAVLCPLPSSSLDSQLVLEVGSTSYSTTPPFCFSGLDTYSDHPPARTLSDVISKSSTEVSLPSLRTEECPPVSVCTVLEVSRPSLRTEECPPVSVCTAFGSKEGSRFIGLSLDREDNLWFYSSPSLTRTPLLKLVFGLIPFGLGFKLPMGPAPLLRKWAGLPPDFISGEAAKERGRISAGPGSSYTSSDSENRVNQAFLSPSSPQSSFLPSTPRPCRSVSLDSDPLFSEVKKAAALFGLELEGSKRLGSEAAIDSCSDISARLSRSRRDMEWHRLGFSPDSPLVSGPRSSRRDSCPSPDTRHEF
ncbi:hypothetical protein LINPERHAP1_LOCUS10605 [Linum perenne]